jgi:hypothetical protein
MSLDLGGRAFGREYEPQWSDMSHYTITVNRITRLAIKTGLTDNGRVEVTAGLSEQTPVVASTKGVPPLRTSVQPQMVSENS